MKIHIKNGFVVDPMNGINEIKDIYIENGKIARYLAGPFDREIDASDCYVLPGLIDAHCHLRDPGYEYKEDIRTGTESAAKGGFTSVACMPNTKPVCDTPSVVEYIKSKAKKHAKTNVFPIGAISKNLEGKELAEVGLMAREGIVAISDDGRPVEQADLMMKAMKYARDFDITCISHCEDLSLASDTHMNESLTSAMMGIAGNPSISEEIMVAREILLSGYLGIPVHIAHVSSKGSIDMIRKAKAQGVLVTCETCPHYFTLTQEECLGYQTLAKVNPPLKTQEDLDAVIEGIVDGTIDMIVTDHAPHHNDEKNIEFSLASNGIAGFETAFSLAYTYLVREKMITLEKLVHLMSVNPSGFLKIGRGTLGYQSPADVTIIDTHKEYTFDVTMMCSKARNNPYNGWKLYGKPIYTITGGEIVYEELC
jgi:dihydroorotase